MRAPSAEEWGEILHVDQYSESRMDYCNRMIADGFEILTPEKGELQIDLDSDAAFETFKVRFERLKAEFGEFQARVKPSKSGLPHRHVIVDFDVVSNLSATERIALQAVLGSDPMREMLSIFRYFREDPCPTLLAMKNSDQGWENL